MLDKDFKTKNIIEDKDGHVIMTKVPAHQEEL